MNRRRLYLIGGILLVLFACFAFVTFQDALTPYLSFHEARLSHGTLQVAGALVDGSSYYDEAAKVLHFELREPATGDTLAVRYDGVKPANFEDAVSIVAIGHWDAQSEAIAAGKLLVKCPSKYKGAAVERSYGGSRPEA